MGMEMMIWMWCWTWPWTLLGTSGSNLEGIGGMVSSLLAIIIHVPWSFIGIKHIVLVGRWNEEVSYSDP